MKFKEVNPFTHREEEIHKIYIGSTATSFKTRYGNHKQTFIKIDQENKTTLSGEIWRLKRIRPDYDFDLKFSVLVLAKAYNRESKMCQLNYMLSAFILRNINWIDGFNPEKKGG